mmetsp:Transcript_107345/g.283019  ORF Transcript_107345/g.283019 Transcript_107345/m.283019 type:complete len:202 (-) Transcript_107345:91-696(-)
MLLLCLSLPLPRCFCPWARFGSLGFPAPRLLSLWLPAGWTHESYRPCCSCCYQFMYQCSDFIYLRQQRHCIRRIRGGSWEARGGQTITRWFAYDKFLSTRKTALRGAFDGGVSNEGCGGGWWLQIGVVGRGSSVQVDFPISSSSSSSSSSCTSSHSFHWHDVAEEAMSLPPGSTVTCCELTACAALTRAAAKVACALLRPA